VKEIGHWFSPNVQQQTQLVRWGRYGTPVLVFPTAGGDAEEIERFLMIKVLEPLLEAGKVKIYSVDSIAGAAWISKRHLPAWCSRLQTLFDRYIYDEVVPAIRADCKAPEIEILTAGASIGAFNALSVLCRHPDVFSKAICMSGSYDFEHWLDGQWNSDFYFGSPIHFVPSLADGSEQLDILRRRFVALPTGEGPWEEPAESWKVAHALGSKGIPNRVDLWGQEWSHDWPTWRAMLPKYLAEMA
jgi:esterase/lipase superfamily enzyme